MPCLICDVAVVEGAHVIAKSEFAEVYFKMHSVHPNAALVDTQNIVDLCPNHHRIQMDQLIGQVKDFRKTKIVYDFINSRSLTYCNVTGVSEWIEWNHVPLVHRKYFAYSNERAVSILKRKIKRIDKRLIDYLEWCN